MVTGLHHYLLLKDELAYRRHFEKKYCTDPIVSHDGYTVRFRKSAFDHAFFETDRKTRKKTKRFSLIRAKHMDWIKLALKDPAAEMRYGWDHKSKTIDPSRRVTVLYQQFAVILAITDSSNKKAEFITAYPPSSSTLKKMLSHPKWQ